MKAAYFVLLLAALTGAATCLFIKTYIFVDISMDWTEAQTYCRNNYVDLASITSEEELHNFLETTFHFFSWIGLSKDAHVNNHTQWSDGIALVFTRWKGREFYLDSEQAKQCVVAVDTVWLSYNCTYKLPFTCYTLEPQVIVVQQMKTWDEALKHCRTFYTNLISLPINQDLQLTKNKTTNVQTPSFWIGLRFLDGSWFWLNQEPLWNQFSLPSCPVPHLRCGAKQTGEDMFENRDCEEKMNFVCYH